MNPSAPPEPAEAPAPSSGGFPWKPAITRGFLAFAIVALAGLAIPVLIDVFGAGLAGGTVLRLGWLYTLAFHRVGIRFVGVPIRAEIVLAIALATGTAFAAWLLYREGRRIAMGTVGPVRSALAGAAIAPTYALPFLVLTLVVHAHLALLPLYPEAVRIEGVAWQAFVCPFALAAVAGGIGGLVDALPSRSIPRAALVAGWKTLLVGLGGALVGLLIVAAVRPAGLATYARVVGDHGPRRAGFLLGHQALLAPNIAIDLLVPSMGGCVALYGEAASYDVLCPGRLPSVDPVDVLRAVDPASPGHRALAFSRPMPIGYRLFVLVPLIATIWGGRLAARPFDRWSDRLAAAAAGGLVFAVAVGVTAWLANLTVRLATPIAFGPRPVPSFALGLAWGVGGGLLGAALPFRQTPVPEPGLGPDPEPVPPSPTSV